MERARKWTENWEYIIITFEGNNLNIQKRKIPLYISFPNIRKISLYIAFPNIRKIPYTYTFHSPNIRKIPLYISFP